MSREGDPGLSRRAFLQIAGLGAAVAGCSPSAATQKLASALNPPIDQVPGTPVFYRTVCRECSAGCGVTARTRDGRVTKLEGNPDDPIGRGTLCARGQAGVQRLYAPDRLKGPMRRNAAGAFEPIAWDDAIASLAAALEAAHGKANAAGVRILTRPEPGSAGAVQRALLESLGAASSQRVVLEPFDPWALRAAGKTLFDREEMPAFDLAAARSVVSFGADFLETWLSPVELTRDFSSGRGRDGDARTRLTWIGPRLSATAACADSWLSARPGSEATVALAILRWLVDPANGVAGLSKDAAGILPLVSAFGLAEAAASSGVPAADIERVARELSTRRPSALLGPGASSAGDDASTLALAVLLVNHVLGNVGKTVLYGLDPGEDSPSPPSAMTALVADMAAGRVEVLLVHHADPAGTLPASMGAAAALAKVPLIVSFSDRLDATTRHAHLVLPDHHSLESWGDVTARRGLVALGQPAMTPLADTRAASQTIFDVAGKLAFAAAKFPVTEYYEFVRSRLEARQKQDPAASADAPVAQRAAFARGGTFAPAAPSTVSRSATPLPAFPAPAAPPKSGELALVFFPTALRGDGSTADLPWLREIPDVTSTISWTGWAEFSHATAARLGVTTGRRVALTTSSGTVELPAYVYPGLRDEVIAVCLGGSEANALVPAAGAKPLASFWRGGAVTVRVTGRALLAQMEGMPEPHAGALFSKVVSEEGGGKSLKPMPKLSMYKPPEHPKHRWSMSIDLDKCTGCNACTVACYAENNLPVMGAQRLSEGRSMAWLRIERYFEDGDPARADFVPMLCQQCDNAPCEVVCPVDATYHTSEGLNAQVYNRCVGTRYCANNCPYKVRVFNYQDPKFESPLHMQLNPDVSVRSKGVMEKCTFCVQRIRYGENAARDEGREVADGEVTTACAQTCPAKAIVFGDSKDPVSKIAGMQKDPRGFGALEELNTRPAITYLARVQPEKKKEPAR